MHFLKGETLFVLCTLLDYMFSNNYINSLLSTRFDFDDEEVVSWYVSFIKSLSLLVNPATIKLFLNERAKHFPIYSESVKFFLAKDSMVRTHCRNVTLSLFRGTRLHPWFRVYGLGFRVYGLWLRAKGLGSLCFLM